MKKNKLHITFHNPNTKDETIKYISKILAEVAVTKILKTQKLNTKTQTV